MTASGTGLRFDFEWRLTLATVLLVPLFVGLGFWQRERAAEKVVLAERWDQRQQLVPAPLAELTGESADTLAYRPVRVSGEYLRDRQFLLDNRIQGGRYGNEVVSVLRRGDGGGLLLVNRGWVAADPARRALPEVPLPPGPVTVSGHIYVPPGAPYLLSDQVLDEGWPKRIQAVQVPLLAEVLAASGEPEPRLFPYTVRLGAGEPGALAVDWKVVNVSPEKHLGYSLQWFAMALALGLLFLFRTSNVWSVLTGRGGR